MTARAPSDLEARLQRLEDAEAARGMFQTYAATLDTPDPDTAAALFTPDAVLITPAGTFTGREEIRGFYAGAFAADPSVKRHFIVNPRVVSAEPGAVRLQSHFLYVGSSADRSAIGWGTYDDVVDVTGPAPMLREKAIAIHVGTDLATGWGSTP